MEYNNKVICNMQQHAAYVGKLMREHRNSYKNSMFHALTCVTSDARLRFIKRAEAHMRWYNKHAEAHEWLHRQIYDWLCNAHE